MFVDLFVWSFGDFVGCLSVVCVLSVDVSLVDVGEAEQAGDSDVGDEEDVSDGCGDELSRFTDSLGVSLGMVLELVSRRTLVSLVLLF